jgi:hypothetical protein
MPFPGQKILIMHRLENRICKDGLLRFISQQTRSQAKNRDLAIKRFAELLQDALKRVPIRKKTRVSKGAARRLKKSGENPDAHYSPYISVMILRNWEACEAGS